MVNKVKPTAVTTLLLALVLLLHGTAVASAFTLSGRVTNQSGYPLPGTIVEVIDPATSNTLVSTSTDSGGNYAVSVDSGAYNVRVTPPAGSGFGAATALNRTIDRDTILDFVLVPAGSVRLSGRMLDALGNPLAEQYVSIRPVGTHNSTQYTTGASGYYEFEVAPGDYELDLYRAGNPAASASRYYELHGQSALSLSQSMVMDIQLPFKRVAVHVQDPAGNPVANVALHTNYVSVSDLMLGVLPAGGQSGYPTWYEPVRTDATGDATLWLFPNAGRDPYTLTAIPPAGSPFITFNVFDVSVTTDKTIIIVLQFVHPPPATTAAITPPPNAEGLYPDPVTVALSAAAAPGYSIAATRYSIDGGPDQPYTAPFAVAGAGAHTIEYWSVDDYGVYEVPKTLTFEIMSNQPPTVDAGGPYSVNEGGSVTITALGTDPDDDPLTYAWDLDNDGTFETAGQTAIFSAANLDGPGSHTIAVQVADSGGLTARDQAAVVVFNVAPDVGVIAAPVDPKQVNTVVSAQANFTDPGVLDAHTAVWDWGDGTTSAGTVDETNGSGSVIGAHTYSAPGVYTLGLTVIDKDGGSDASVFAYVVVYDPEGGFVTGGGWINSPLAAYMPDPSLTGRATFGFVSKYKKGAAVPTGQTEFQFRVANMNFHSESYDWLIVAGAKAQYKGVGTINGAGNYGFMLTAIDGQVNGGGGIDKFRIKIWDRADGHLVYDNMLGAEDTVDPATAVQAGTIVVHAGR